MNILCHLLFTQTCVYGCWGVVVVDGHKIFVCFFKPENEKDNVKNTDHLN